MVKGRKNICRREWEEHFAPWKSLDTSFQQLPGEPTSLPERAEVWGRIVREVGSRGEIRVHIRPDRAEIFSLSRYLIIKTVRHLRRFTVEYLIPQKSSWRIKLEEINNPSQVEPFLGADIIGNEPENLPYNDGEYAVKDLIGCEVVSETGDLLGVLIDVHSYPHHDVWVVESKGREMMIPAVQEIIREVDLKNRRVVVVYWEGL
ncbi:MAG: ribosome maturation factor RimM [bacterium]